MIDALVKIYRHEGVPGLYKVPISVYVKYCQCSAAGVDLNECVFVTPLMCEFAIVSIADMIICFECNRNEVMPWQSILVK